MVKINLPLIITLSSLALTLFLAALDIVIVITLYETIGQKYRDYASIGWLVSGYALPSALFTLLWGRLASIFGLKTSLTISIVIFEIGSLIVAVSNSMGMLIGGRVVAGCGGSGIQSLVFVVATSLVKERNRGLVIMVLGFSFAVAFAIGPVLGGVFTEHVTWRWCFFINLPIGGLALALLLSSYNPTSTRWQDSFRRKLIAIKKFSYRQLLTSKFWHQAYLFLAFKLDLIGFAISSSGFVLFLLGVTFGGNEYPWHSGTIISYLTVGGFLIILWVLFDFSLLYRWAKCHQNVEPVPLLRKTLCYLPGIATSSLTVFFGCLAFNMQSVYVVQYYQLVHNNGPTSASMHLWGFLVATLISIVAIGKVSSTFGIIKPEIVVGVTLGLIGAGLLTLIKTTSTTGNTIGYCILPGAAFGCILQGTLLSAQVQVDRDTADFHTLFIEATALNTFFKSLGMSFGGIMATMIFTNSVKNQLRDTTAGLPPFSNIEALIAYRGQHFDGSNSVLSNVFAKGIRNVMYAALGSYAIAFMSGLFTSNRRLVLPSKADDLEHSSADHTIHEKTSSSTEGRDGRSTIEEKPKITFKDKLFDAFKSRKTDQSLTES
ncbi:LAME_0D09692g1_1 [Lachancea meyersii CBS 8951]|uniref:LAME_0D09692g1_1 n=1 Tax=Lachancea meyersii CBS 8951 TaxID=1266667 RepID=A0A1G4JBD8_9SACH|nr:LAME_0D09692g1_1 [Lachancea meyersii CBS 8951]